MAATNINRVILTGNLTKDPELRSLPSGTAVCRLRLACNTRRKDASSGDWVDKPNFFDVTVWGKQGENCAQYLSKGRPVAIDGRLFGSVTNQDIVDAIREARGLRIDRRKVHLEEPIRNVGTHMVVVEVADGVTATVKTMVVEQK